MAAIQLLGIGDDPVVLSAHQLHGDRTLLLSQPEAIRLDIRLVKRPASQQQQAASSLAPVWRSSVGGRQVPDSVDVPSATVLQDHVYRSLQHALFGLLLGIHGGMNGHLAVRVHPRGAHVFPDFLVEDVHTLLPDAGEETAPVAIQLLSQEPGPHQLTAFAHSLLAHPGGGLWGLILVVGTIKLQPPRGTVDAVPLRALVMRTANLPHPVVPPVLPMQAVEHGWYLCVDAGTLCLAPHGQRDGKLLPLAVLPALASVGFRLWRKGQATFALAPKGQAQANPEWDATIRRFLEHQEGES